MDSEALARTIGALRSLDSCSVANAIETLNLRLRNEGYTDRRLHRQTAGDDPVVGFAATVRIRTSSPPPDRKTYLEDSSWLELFQTLPKPRLLVVEEMDATSSSGAFIGEIHASLLMAMDCHGVVTNGAVRDVTRLERRGFSAYSAGLSVSHAYAHIVDRNLPVTVAGLRVHPGDLLHGDRHGVVSIPWAAAKQVPKIAERQREKEERILAYCGSPHFTLDGLRDVLAG